MTIDVARQYAALDIAAELGISASAMAALEAPARPKSHHWWEVDVHVDVPVAKLAAAAAAVAAAAAAAVARDVATGGLALG